MRPRKRYPILSQAWDLFLDCATWVYSYPLKAFIVAFLAAAGLLLFLIIS